ncbi:M23 family metallopeptidase [Demequina aurantiaca]|uniref:M23 family metallopeptidase n=1 Tax=Demequina aurantiaca TaxID=676200 RepID=UPI000A0672AA|nr:M23 family metallopeptidase [Demequina aurantiaca]
MRHTRGLVALSLALVLTGVGLGYAQAQVASGSPPSVAGAVFNGAHPAGVADTSAHIAGTARPVLTSPVTPMRAVRLFDPPPERWNAGHRGIDLRAGSGVAVRSPGAGTVAFAGVVVNRPVLSIDLDVGLRASLEPVATDLQVGDRVIRGEPVGTVVDAPGAGHCEPQRCVHWGLRRGDDYVNPLDWLEGYGPIVLLPLHGSPG